MTQSNLNTVPDTDPGYGQLFAILIRRRLWLLGILCLALGIATFKAFTTKSTYVSSLQLLVEPNYQSKRQDGQEGAEKQIVDPNIQVDSATQLNLMQGSQLLQKALDLLRPDYPDLTLKELRKSLSVFQVEGSQDDSKTKIFAANYTANDPVKTQKVLQAVQRVYLNYNREQQRLRLAKGLAFIDEQLPKARLSVTQSEAALEKFRKTQNLIEPDAQTTALTTALNAIQDERRRNQAQYRELQASYNTLQQQVARSPQDALVSSRLSQSTRYQSLLDEIQKTDLALAEQRKRFTDDNPTIQKLLFQRQQQLALLEKEGERAVGKNSSQLKGENLLTEGQLGETDVNLTNKLLELESSIRGLMAREQTLAEKEQQLRVELERFPSVLADYNRLQPEIKLKRETLDQLEKARQELSLEIARGGFDWQVVEQPLLGEKTGPKKAQIILLGAVAGVMLGGIAAFIRETMDDAVRSSDELKQQVALPVLGMTPVLPKAKKSEPRMLLPFGKSQALEPVGNQPIIKLPFGKPKVLAPWTVEVLHWSPSWQSLDLIYKNIQLLSSVSTLRSLMVTSAVAGEGKSTLALGLAISAARLHQRVLLIDADLRNPTLHEKLNLPNDYGLSTLLSSDAPLPIQTSLHASSAYIDVITSGPISPDPANLLSSPRMGELMAEFEQSYDLVLVDAPPVLGLVDSILTASYCGGVLLVARMGQITKTELTQATAMLSKLNLIGVVANGDNSSYNSYAPQSTRGANKEDWGTERTAQLVSGVPIHYEGNPKNAEPVNSEK
ncbi:GumC family protein [Allocoleopsis franciscana]|uniref:Capsular exopolysaccharide biosynthesis protein n=1 Tax=Allocoleopsis franciscana PCC 7113 TaxID=1173027 RepID=K9W742_9CYAN|nr:polysaccharide biosynthesis tyrosine autokinase [Allocoleopsis franciscana]AFZ16033.1 capsular exopolysaccharide biosynthesis protein [Allocoleopsis franciscana PCC 7113]